MSVIEDGWVVKVIGLGGVGGVTVVQAVRSKIKIEESFLIINERPVRSLRPHRSVDRIT